MTSPAVVGSTCTLRDGGLSWLKRQPTPNTSPRNCRLRELHSRQPGWPWQNRVSWFQTASLPASELGERLLVGRAEELRSLERKISSGPKIATLEGLNGVGKTSIVNVAA